jgi:hypothetical protein
MANLSGILRKNSMIAPKKAKISTKMKKKMLKSLEVT